MKIDLSDKTAIVTGSTAGIGFAIAKGLAEAGVVVVVNGRSERLWSMTPSGGSRRLCRAPSFVGYCRCRHGGGLLGSGRG
jgi:NAD(P)-dependent dehydrogenase (short-subunit alcohol dehydrogenase family)